jgi:PAS domain S-box-containing protein
MIVANEVTDLVHARQLAEESRLHLERKVEERTLELGQRTEELRKQKEFLETILDSSVDMIGVYDRDTRIVAFNKRCEEMYHLKRENALGRTFAEVYPQAIGSQSHKDLLRALAGEAVHNEVYQSPFTGRFLENFLLPLRDENQRIYGALVIAHDVTEIQEATQKLRHTNAALEKSNHDLEQFAYVASHDLQEPLRKISTFSELLRRSSPDLSPQAHQYIDKILRSSHRMADLIRDVLSYSTLSKSGEQHVDTDLNDILKNILADYELLIRQKNATIHHGPLPTVRAVPLQMHQLFSNLLANSLKFSTREPVIHITARKLDDAEAREDHRLDPSGHYIEILFKDNGIGFEQQYAEQIFTIFQRLNSREDYQGTGIGLALCKKIIDNHRGSIHATSALDQGAVFHLRLPVIP